MSKGHKLLIRCWVSGWTQVGNFSFCDLVDVTGRGSVTCPSIYKLYSLICLNVENYPQEHFLFMYISHTEFISNGLFQTLINFSLQLCNTSKHLS